MLTCAGSSVILVPVVVAVVARDAEGTPCGTLFAYYVVRSHQSLEMDERGREMKAWQVRSNAAVHGLEFAAKKHKEACKKESKPSNFDLFYFAIFGKYPKR